MIATDRFVEEPLQIVAVPDNTAVLGLALTVTVGVPLGVVAVQPLLSVTDVSVYPVVVLGLTIMLEPLV